MDYIELNTIPEVASSDEEPVDLISLPLKFSIEDDSEVPESPLSALLRQESIRSRYDFSRQDSLYKQKSALETFPSIKGFDYEQGKPTAEAPKRRPSNLLKVTLSDQLRVDSEKEIRSPDDDMKSLGSENLDKTLTRKGTRRAKTFNAAENIEILKNIIIGKSLAPETMLIAAIGSIYEIDLNIRKKDLQLLDLASNNLENANMKHDQVIMYQDELQEDMSKLQTAYAATQEETLKIEDDIAKCKSMFTENRILIENKLKNINHKIYLAKNGGKSLSYILKETIEKYNFKLNECLEIEEKYMMNNEDLYTEMHIIENSRTKAENMNKELQKILEDMGKERAKKKMLKEKIRICTQSLCEVTRYLNDNKNKKEMIQEFRENLTSIKKEIDEAIVAEKGFEINAITDPKSILPYYRSSDTNIK
ncbi:hypothetical protein SteCoe_5670 [Stentor coeruleus]|uniref:Uncharacterized protein n=1 Tax=Stentor coeruleus TaxID=5963 RepID=A0A1R2CRZ0_9CILI|nr:hypothetical protein SteCoe_5670 [Stentor coeruleus]